MADTLLILVLFALVGLLGALIYYQKKNEPYGVHNYKKAGASPSPLFNPTRCKCGEVPQLGPSRPFSGCSLKNVVDPMKNFEPSLSRQCDGGAYMYTSNPALTQACAAAPYSDTFDTCRQPGFQGRPITFEYLNLSDNHWKNSLTCGSNGPNGDSYHLPATTRGVVGPPLRPLEQEALARGDQICIL